MTTNYKKYIIAGLFLAIVATVGMSAVPAAQAYSPNAAWARNQTQWPVQNMNQLQRQSMIQVLLKLQTRIREMLDLLEIDIDDDDGDSEINVVTLPVVNIDDDEALLQGRIADFNRSDYADVWFEYDTDRNDLDNKTSVRRIDDNEYRNFGYRLTSLRDDTTYYYRAVGKDDEGERDYGAVYRFTTDDDNGSNDDDPNVTTLSATAVQDDQADLRGSVDMNDFRDGEVFFVYGEDEDQVADVEDDFDSYRDVDEDGDDLQKVLVDNDLDSDDSYLEEVDSLDDDTRHYFSICVGYEDEDEDDDEVLKCGTVRGFTTDN